MAGAGGADRVAPAILAGAVATTVLLVAPGLGRLGYDAYALPKELAATAVLVAAAVVILRAAGNSLRLRPSDLLLGGFLLLTLASALQPAANPWLGGRSLLVTTAAAATFWCARAVAGRSPGRLLGAFAAIAVAAAVMALAEAQGWVSGWSPRGTAPGGTFGNRNFMAHTLLLVVPLLAAVGVSARRGPVRIAALLGLALVGHALALSHCRGAWLAGIVALVVTAAVGLWTRGAERAGRRVVAVAGALGIGIVTAVSLPNDLGWREGNHFRASLGSMLDVRTGTGRGRLIQARNTAAMAADHPVLGVGAGGWSLAYPSYAAPGDPSYKPGSSEPVQRLPNGDWLGVASQRGLPALLVLIAFLAVLARGAWRQRSAWQLGLLAAVAVSGLVDANLARAEHALVLFALLGTSAAGHDEATLVAVRPGRAAGAVAALAIVVLTLHLGTRATRNLAAARIVAAVEPGQSRSAVVAAFERAAALTPDDYRLHLALADHHRSCEQAVAHARAALHLNPASAGARATLARCGD